ncbi:unnamed protein product [Schistocephalus solidus]|uniref:Uncharacterized protein n=1 Tax=Schistocephalus solidus TaxID=70667 RepID=A0A183T2L0_SCHSO|nr:unnamed protein product [Schistocephalus solidus]
MHPRLRRWQLLDYVLVRRRDRQDVLVTKAIRDNDGWTDHRLISSKMRLRLQTRRRPLAISDAAIDRFPQVDTNNDLHLPPSLPETIRAVQQIFSGKAPGSDAIPPEVYKHGGPRLMANLTTLFQEMWCQGQVPQDFKHDHRPSLEAER